MKTSLPVPQMIFGTIMMLVITAMVYDFVDPQQCDGVTDLEDKQKCGELAAMIFNSVPIVWILYTGVGVVLFLLKRNAERNE